MLSQLSHEATNPQNEKTGPVARFSRADLFTYVSQALLIGA
jgi:hypothetical protein